MKRLKMMHEVTIMIFWEFPKWAFKAIFPVLLVFSVNAQTVKVKLLPNSKYYKDSIINRGVGGVADKGYTYTLFRSIQPQGCFAAKLNNKTVYLYIGDISITNAYRAYFSKHFFNPPKL